MLVDGFHLSQPADGFFQPFKDQLNSINGKTGWCVEHGVFIGKCLIVQHGRKCIWTALQQVVADNDQANAGGTHIFLGAGVNEAKRFDIKRSTQDVRRHIGNQGDIAGVRKPGPLGAFDGVIGSDVGIHRVGGKLNIAGNIGKVLILGRSHHLNGLALNLGLFDRFG